MSWKRFSFFSADHFCHVLIRKSRQKSCRLSKTQNMSFTFCWGEVGPGEHLNQYESSSNISLFVDSKVVSGLIQELCLKTWPERTPLNPPECFSHKESGLTVKHCTFRSLLQGNTSQETERGALLLRGLDWVFGASQPLKSRKDLWLTPSVCPRRSTKHSNSLWIHHHFLLKPQTFQVGLAVFDVKFKPGFLRASV